MVRHLTLVEHLPGATTNQGFFALLGGALEPLGLGKLAQQTPKLGHLLLCTIMSFLVNKKTN